ncbi:T-cell immunomodulatory protein isoform X2 [Procambarus clarkii]|uniref:T-cell immunomodulatory protein isoform X2 n=1 Tax=Procambarus clarkii TaxID=6728 RepID=UPI001E6747CF|nr:T-cell immunomodulatory protein-like isoform X3 [Procambarus clarkii]XP_045607866.1 T-cell immunomodulatory protein-like isoform X3 [Procambarus clarkii]
MRGYKVLACHLTLLCVAVLPSWALNITDLVFGGNTKYLPAAFGDFNSDKLTDLFVVSEDGKNMKVLISYSEQPLMREPKPNAGPACTYESLSIKSLVPGDFDGNGEMDVLLVSSNKNVAPHYQVFVLWGNLLNMTLECGSEKAPLLTLRGQPLVMDVNGDMIPDLFGEDETGQRTFWIFGPDRKSPKAEPMAEYNDSHSELKQPSSHAFIDLNSDLVADLWVTTKKNFEIWSISNGVYIYNETITPWKNMTHIGQTSFMDVDLDGDIEAIVPVCMDAKCGKSSVFIYDFQSSNKAGWVELDVSFVDPKGNTWGYPPQATKSYRYSDTITLRVGDYNLDGYPDFLVTLLDQNEKAQVILMENVACGDDKCKHPRKFVPKWDLFKDFGETVLGTFCDFQEDGTLDVLLVCKAADGTYHLNVYKDPVEYDAVFVKVLIPTGRCYGNDCPLKNIPYGTNQPGPSITYSITTATGSTQRSRATQLLQSAHYALQLPYTVFGLGRNWNFVEVMEVGIPRGNTSGTFKSSFTQIIPNSQLIVIPYPMEYPDRWVSKLFITPSKAMLMTAGALVGTCLFVAAIIGILHRREKQQDKREKQQDAHKFHFDAM